MSHRVNFIIDDANWHYLSAVPRGERSRLVNQALAEYHRVQTRRQAAHDMDRLSRELPEVEGSSEIWVRTDRDTRR